VTAIAGQQGFAGFVEAFFCEMEVLAKRATTLEVSGIPGSPSVSMLLATHNLVIQLTQTSGSEVLDGF